jgi:hypothetical protein
VEGSWEDRSNIGGSEDRRMWRITCWLIYEPDLGGESDAEDRSWNLEEGKSSTIVRNFDHATHTTNGHISIKVERKSLMK